MKEVQSSPTSQRLSSSESMSYSRKSTPGMLTPPMRSSPNYLSVVTSKPRPTPMSEAQALYFPLIWSVLNTEGTAPGMEAGRKAHCKLTKSAPLHLLASLSFSPPSEEAENKVDGI